MDQIFLAQVATVLDGHKLLLQSERLRKAVFIRSRLERYGVLTIMVLGPFNSPLSAYKWHKKWPRPFSTAIFNYFCIPKQHSALSQTNALGLPSEFQPSGVLLVLGSYESSDGFQHLSAQVLLAQLFA